MPRQRSPMVVIPVVPAKRQQEFVPTPESDDSESEHQSVGIGSASCSGDTSDDGSIVIVHPEQSYKHGYTPGTPTPTNAQPGRRGTNTDRRNASVLPARSRQHHRLSQQTFSHEREQPTHRFQLPPQGAPGTAPGPQPTTDLSQTSSNGWQRPVGRPMYHLQRPQRPVQRPVQRPQDPIQPAFHNGRIGQRPLERRSPSHQRIPQQPRRPQQGCAPREPLEPPINDHVDLAMAHLVSGSGSAELHQKTADFLVNSLYQDTAAAETAFAPFARLLTHATLTSPKAAPGMVLRAKRQLAASLARTTMASLGTQIANFLDLDSPSEELCFVSRDEGYTMQLKISPTVQVKKEDDFRPEGSGSETQVGSEHEPEDEDAHDWFHSDEPTGEDDEHEGTRWATACESPRPSRAVDSPGEMYRSADESERRSSRRLPRAVAIVRSIEHYDSDMPIFEEQDDERDGDYTGNRFLA